jgi:peptidoglycan DL-endopeptidase LytF
MTRRDTILVAALINAGLLVILFATAVTKESQLPQVAVAPPQEMIPAPVVVEQPPAKFGDEIDQVLHQFNSEPLALSFPAVPAEPPKVQPARQERVEVTVKRGDSLDKIARANGSTIAAIMQANGMSDSRLQIGKVLQVPVTKKQEQAPSAPPPLGESEGTYTIASGDNPWLVASKFQIPLDELLRLNDLDEDRARRLKPGDRIRIR